MTPEQQAAIKRAQQAMAIKRAEASLAGGQATAPEETGNTVSGVVSQFGVGSQSGIASALGFPVDAITGGINGLGDLTGMWDPIESPVGGSDTFNALFKPLNENVPAPQTGLERGARRVGEEVGASAAMLPVAFASPAVRAAPIGAAAVEGASALGSGTGAAIANEVAPDSAVADVIGALAGGLPAGMAASRALGLNGTDAVVRPGIEDQRMRAADAYGEVRADQRVLPQASVDDMALNLSDNMDANRINPRLHPGSSAVLDAILDDSSGPMRIEDVENLRRLTQRGLPVTASPDDGRLAGMMTDDITSYLDDLNDPVADRLREGRDAHRRGSAAAAITEATTKASRRAARTGSGGNEINATRQNISRLIENPRTARSFKPEELAMMDEVVRGTGAQNAARRLSRFAPSSGGLSAMLGMGAAVASPQFALPVAAVTEAAKAFGEKSTRSSIEALLQSLAPDKVLSSGEAGIDGVIAALLAGRTAAQDR